MGQERMKTASVNEGETRNHSISARRGNKSYRMKRGSNMGFASGGARPDMIVGGKLVSKNDQERTELEKQFYSNFDE